MKTAELNPFIRYASLHSTEVHRSKYVSVCYDCRVFFSVKATGVLIIGDKKYDISNNTAVFLPPGTHYRFFFNKENSGKVIFINCDLVSDFSHMEKSLGTAVEEIFDEAKVTKYPLLPELSKPIVKNVPDIYHMLSRITENFMGKSVFYREESSALLKLCLIELIKKTKESKHSKLCESVMEFIRENYADSSVTNAVIAEKFSYHPYHLSRIMKEETGKSIHKYLMDYRLRAAKNLLSTTAFSVEEIAYKTGFSQTAYFVKSFRQKTGMTPKKYRSSVTLNL